MQQYVDEKIIEGFRIAISQQIEESIEFATKMANGTEGAQDEEETRQAAQDALVELLVPTLVEATAKGYDNSPLGAPDFDAISLIFQRLATRAKLCALCTAEQFPSVEIVTRKGTVSGKLYGLGDHDDQYCAHLNMAGEDLWIQVDSIQEVHAG
ncbi:MAG: hypothetical protein JWR61_5803 [Ferruginibacter sp.]|uniref:hypothetical protein n=1 Tax=Ferruginibacter sp. TaxID=1940288 RepID=UPI0026585049|nr:hypothetical protein [Ferruginibacter sp.]MDB5280848.1 hypothetical protein [Ferruginibacter sp.]